MFEDLSGQQDAAGGCRANEPAFWGRGMLPGDGEGWAVGTRIEHDTSRGEALIYPLIHTKELTCHKSTLNRQLWNQVLCVLSCLDLWLSF